MKHPLLLAGILLILFHTSAQAQQKGPLAMEIMVHWTAAGSLTGALISAALWLTDPGNPNIHLGDQMVKGGSLGAFLGAAYGLYVMQTTVILPQGPVVKVNDPLHPSTRITSDPIGATSEDNRILSLRRPSSRASGWELRLPLINLRF